MIVATYTTPSPSFMIDHHRNICISPREHMVVVETSHVDPPPNCSNYPTWDEAPDRVQHHQYSTTSTHVHSMAYYQSFLGQLESRFQCMKLIEAFEERTRHGRRQRRRGERRRVNDASADAPAEEEEEEEEEDKRKGVFDWVIIARPDLVWYRSVAPWCLHDVGELGKRFGDWVFWVPRNKATSYFVTPHEEHHNCRLPVAPGAPLEVSEWLCSICLRH